jgi:hypothetical protein
MARAPSFEEARGGLRQQLAELIAQGLGQMGVDLRGSQAAVPQQDLDDADVDAPLEHVRGETVAERVRPKTDVEAALVPRFVEGVPGGGVTQMGEDPSAGKDPFGATVEFPDLAEHLKNGFGQREDPLLVPLPDDVEHHLLRIDRRDGQGDGLVDP